MYNERAVSTLQYVAQFAQFPAEMLYLEMSTVNVVLHMPPNTLTLSAAMSTDRAGLVHVRSACASALSAIVRAAKCTFMWKAQLEKLVHA
eukprot:6720678-Lingulodinium_polyedra.AAC.1